MQRDLLSCIAWRRLSRILQVVKPVEDHERFGLRQPNGGSRHVVSGNRRLVARLPVDDDFEAVSIFSALTCSDCELTNPQGRPVAKCRLDDHDVIRMTTVQELPEVGNGQRHPLIMTDRVAGSTSGSHHRKRPLSRQHFTKRLPEPHGHRSRRPITVRELIAILDNGHQGGLAVTRSGFHRDGPDCFSMESAAGEHDDVQTCRRCRRPVAASDFALFEQMHYVCFHYEFEHDPADVDSECKAGGCPSANVALRWSLPDWTDWDLAAFHLGRSLGFFNARTEFRSSKSTFWSTNALGNLLHEQLRQLADSGILELREEPDLQFRWADPPTGERMDDPDMIERLGAQPELEFGTLNPAGTPPPGDDGSPSVVAGSGSGDLSYFTDRGFEVTIEECELHAELLDEGDPGRASSYREGQTYFCVNLLREGTLIAARYADGSTAGEALTRARRRFGSEQA